MAVTFRPDADLAVLALCSHTDLKRLAHILTWDDAQNKPRPSQQLLDNPEYAEANEAQDLRSAWKAIGAELQVQGGSAAANFVRGSLWGQQGVFYSQIVRDLCTQFDVVLDAGASTKNAEDCLLRSAFLRYQAGIDETRLTKALKEATTGLESDDSTPKSWGALMRGLNDERITCIAVRIAQALGFPVKRAEVNFPTPSRMGQMLPSFLVAPAAILTAAASITASAASSTIAQLGESSVSSTFFAVLEVIRIRRKVLLYPLTAGDMQ